MGPKGGVEPADTRRPYDAAMLPIVARGTSGMRLEGFLADLGRRLDGPVPARCVAMLAPVAALFAFGAIRLHYNLPVFKVWIAEDGLVEWATFAGLAGMAVLAIRQAASLAGPARSAWIMLAAAFLFGAIEEISWGQRLFGWHSPEWFLSHNAQDETNLHNLVLGGIKVNRLVFGKMLGVALGVYLLVLPVLYRRRARVREVLDARALPVPRIYQVLLTLAVWLVSELGRSIYGKSGELQELGVVFVLASVLLHPLNPAAQPLPGGAGALAARGLRVLSGWSRQWLPARVRFLALAAALLVTVFTLFRLAFAAAFEPPGLVGPVGDVIWDRGVPSLRVTGPGLAPVADVARAWALGLRFDLRMALLLLLPLALLGGMRPVDPARSPAARRAWTTWFGLALFVVFFVYASDLGHYAYEAQRLNANLLDHLQEPGIAAMMAWQTYPVLPGLTAIVALAAATTLLLSHALAAPAAPFPGSRRRRIAISIASGALYVLALHGQWSQYPLRWSNAYFSPNPYLSALASNPLQTLFDTWREPSRPVAPAAACAAQARLARTLGVAACSAPPPSFARFVRPGAAARRPNIVVVFLESFAAYKTGIMGNPLTPTPHFDALARSSVLYTRFYSVTSPTARSIFSSLFGIPDVSPGRSASRNPRAVTQHTLVTAFEGYRKHYFIGGSASWGNIRGMLAHNVPGLILHEGEDLDLPLDDVWGVNDLSLFEQAHRVMSAEPGPFIALIQTAGNHRPYTIPAEAPGFRRDPLPEDVLLAAGFAEPDAYDGLRFLDHALGRFLELATAAPYYRDTIFAFYGDHGAPARRFPEIEQPLRGEHVPLVLHAPAWFGAQGRRVDDPASSIDVLPTLAALAGVPHLNTALGHDLMAPGAEHARFAFVTHNGSRGLVDPGHFYWRSVTGRETLHRLRADGSLEPGDRAASAPERRQRMADVAEAFYDSGGWLLEHNPPRVHAPPEAPAGR